MKTISEFFADLYDHNYQYLRWYVHRRVLFSEEKADDVDRIANRYSIFKNKDYENIHALGKETTLIGAVLGKMN